MDHVMEQKLILFSRPAGAVACLPKAAFMETGNWRKHRGLAPRQQAEAGMLNTAWRPDSPDKRVPNKTLTPPIKWAPGQLWFGTESWGQEAGWKGTPKKRGRPAEAACSIGASSSGPGPNSPASHSSFPYSGGRKWFGGRGVGGRFGGGGDPKGLA